MKIIVFMMILATPAGLLPTFEDKMESLEACQAQVDEVTKRYMAIDGDFSFVAACRIVSQKADPV